MTAVPVGPVETNGTAAVCLPAQLHMKAANQFVAGLVVTSHTVIQIKTHNVSQHKGAKPYITRYVEFGPAAGESKILEALGVPKRASEIAALVGTAAQVLLGMCVKGEVVITSGKNPYPWFMSLGQGSSQRQTGGLVDSVDDDSSSLDPNLGDVIFNRATEIQELAKQEKYLYLVTDKLGPVFGSTVEGAKARNCWGFVTDLLSGLG